MDIIGWYDIASVISDAILLAAPLVVIWNLRDNRLKTRLVSTFATCVVTTIVSLFHGACESHYVIYIPHTGLMNVSRYLGQQLA